MGKARLGVSYVESLWVQMGKEMLQATGFRAGRNWATRSEELQGQRGQAETKN